MFDYAGRMILTTGTAAVNGNCIEVKTAQKHIYACNLLMTSGDGAAAFYAEFDYDTLVGTSSAIFNIYNGSSLSDQFVYPISLTQCLAQNGSYKRDRIRGAKQRDNGVMS
jgi:hypothetical protein